MKRYEKALELFAQDFNCAQSIVYGFSDILDPDIGTLLKTASGFGAGMGRTQNTCGAVNGAVIVLGLLYGRGFNESKDKQEDVYSKVQLFIQRFYDQFSSISCFDLLEKCNLLTDEGQERFYSENLIVKCNACVRKAVEILEEFIQT